MSQLQYFQIGLELWGAVFSATCAGILLIRKKYIKKTVWLLISMLVVNAVTMVMDSLAYIYRGNVTSLGIVMTRVSNFMVFSLNYVMFALASAFFYHVMKNHGGREDRRWVNMVHVLCTIGMILVIISQFTDLYYGFDATNHYFRTAGWYYGTIIMYICFGICVYEILLNRQKMPKDIRFALYAFIMIPIVAVMLQMVLYGLSLINVGITFALLLMFLSYEMQEVHDYTALQVEYEHKKMDVAHQAEEERMQKIGLVSFEDEMEVVEDYLYSQIEKYGMDIQVNREIRAVDFKIPSYAIRSLVQYAVCFGLKPKDGVKTLWIKTDRDRAKTYIIIEDDGNGFDTEKINEDPADNYYIDIQGIRKRIQELQGGSLEIRSEWNHGTRIVIIIPDNRDVKL